MSNAVHDDTDFLQRVLEEQFEVHTRHLTELITHGAHLGATGSGGDAARAHTASSRRALADIAHALRRMADGSYGRCEHCAEPIPVGELRIRPQARHCVPCGSRR